MSPAADPRDRLLALAAELRAALAGSQDQAATVDLDQSAVGRLSRVDALQHQAMALEQARRTELRLAQVVNALARVDDGRYGTCLRCGDDIAEARLNARPETPFCRECA